MKKSPVFFLLVFAVFLLSFTPFHFSTQDSLYILKMDASSKEERTAITSLGVAIEEVKPNYIVGIAHEDSLQKLTAHSFKFEAKPLKQFLLDFPVKDADFHNYSEMEAELKSFAEKYPHIAELSSIGESIQQRKLYIMRLSGPTPSSTPKPAIIFMGLHHAREHLSAEVPYFLIKHLLENYGKDEKITQLMDEREIWVLPMVNPDGAEYDIESGIYKFWRKNVRSEGADRMYGVDLNRNYGYRWGQEGASDNPRAETYRGPHAFSEPETQAVKRFVESHPNITILLSYHTYSELILYPWGHTYHDIEDPQDFGVHKTLATEVGRITGYKPQQASDLYITSGDTTDWSYGTHGIYSFTIELYPGSMWEGGFYPSAAKIQKVVHDNIPAALYLIDTADHPRKVLPNLN